MKNIDCLFIGQLYIWFFFEAIRYYSLLRWISLCTLQPKLRFSSKILQSGLTTKFVLPFLVTYSINLKNIKHLQNKLLLKYNTSLVTDL